MFWGQAYTFGVSVVSQTAHRECSWETEIEVLGSRIFTLCKPPETDRKLRLGDEV